MMKANIILMRLLVLFNVAAECLENLSQIDSVRGIPSQSLSYDFGHHADKAVDGQLQDSVSEETCSFTIGGHNIKTAWWKLPFKEMSYVAYLEIYFRNSTVNRHIGFSVFVFNDSTYIPPSNPSQHQVFAHNFSTCLSHVTNVTINKETQGIAIYNSKYPPVNTACAGYEPTFASIELCEIKVMGCPSKHYGENCNLCNPNCRDAVCDAFNGSCIYGCNVLESPYCSECKDGYFGINCTQKCGFCTIDTFCNKTSGICPEGCHGNWSESHCRDCKNGYYGSHCEYQCGKCSTGVFCDNITGICPNGCQDRWNGSNCDVCEEGFYGQTCEACGHCRNGTFCNITTGVCPDSCKDNWHGLLCKVCSEGMYGHHCNDECGHCLIGTLCDKSTGVCPKGCKENWTGPKCDECEAYKYGPNCAFDCGHCKDDKPCSKVSGKCEAGCVIGWTGLYCLKDDGISNTSTAIVYIVSTLAVVTLIYAVVRLAYKKIKRRHHDTQQVATEIIPGKLYDQLAEAIPIPTYQKITPQSDSSHYQEMNLYNNDELSGNK